MAFLTDMYFSDPNASKLYLLSNDAVSSNVKLTSKGPRALLVDKDMITVYTVNSEANNVSVFVNGTKASDIPVGKYPMAICQAKNGDIWVANYNGNTVSKIVNKIVVNTVNVGKGPRGICCDINGNIWVSNYIAGTVMKITNGIVVNTIKVGNAPYGICSDRNGNIWVACSGSNIVTKINNDGEKEFDIGVGKIPWDVCCDKSGAIWVSNYNSKTVSKIVNNTKVLDILVGEGPFGLNATSDGALYVCNYLSNTISKIVNGIVVKTIDSVALNPIGYGDCTGYIYNNLFTQASHSGLITYDDLADSLKSLIDGCSGGSGGIALPIGDNDVTHSHNTYDTVKKALDFLLYEEPAITSFTNSVNNVEKGSTVNNITLNWAVNKPDDMTLVINQGIGEVTGLTSKTLSSANITSDITYTMTASDGTKTITKTTAIKFLNKIYYGSSPSENIADSAAILSLTNNKLASSYALSATFDCSGGKYIYIAVPSSFGLNTSKFKIGGLANSAWTTRTVSFTNASGYTCDYTVFRSNEKQNGSAIKVDIA